MMLKVIDVATTMIIDVVDIIIMMKMINVVANDKNEIENFTIIREYS